VNPSPVIVCDTITKRSRLCFSRSRQGDWIADALEAGCPKTARTNSLSGSESVRQLSGKYIGDRKQINSHHWIAPMKQFQRPVGVDVIHYGVFTLALLK
jgi:hypothetical protein